MDSESDVLQVRYFPVSVTKLVVMSVCTLGLYEIYWAWNCWGFIKSRDGRDLNPFWRSVFISTLYFNFLLIWDVSRSSGDSKYVALARTIICAGGIAALWFAGSGLTRLPLVLASVLSVAPLLAVQVQINRMNQREAPGHDPNRRFSIGDVVIVVLGGLFFLSTVAASLIKPH
jgi:hypothetical protein